VSVGRSSDNGGIETGGIETGGIETGVFEMLISCRGNGATVVANEDVMLGRSAKQVRSIDRPMCKVESLMLG
jgi:hypothetical protein